MNNNRTSEKWTSEKTKLLISEYKKHPCLYKTELAEYRDKSLKVEALQEMAIKIGTTRDEVARKIRGMRSQYAREKARAAAMANEGLPINPWAYYESLLFLDDYVGPKGRRTTTDWNVEFSHDSGDILGAEEAEESGELASMIYRSAVSESIKNEPDEPEDCMIVTPATKPQNPPANEADIFSSRSLASHFQSKRKRLSEVSTSGSRLASQYKEIQTAPNEIQINRVTPQNDFSTLPIGRVQAQLPVVQTAKDVQATVSSTNDSHEGDLRDNRGEDDEIFARYITSELRQIKNAHLKRIVKHKIQNIIFEAHCSLQK